MKFAESVNSKATEALEKVREQVDVYAQKGKNSLDEVKDKAVNLHQNIQVAVERAKNTADPYVKSTRQVAEHIVETGKDGVHVVASTINKGVNHANQLYLSKNRALCIFSHFFEQAYATAQSFNIVPGAQKASSLILGAVERIPVVGPRLNAVILALEGKICQNVERLISQSSINRKHK